MSIKNHLIDIDFRTREIRQESAKDEFINWHRELVEYEEKFGFNPIIHGQLTMISSVLWYMLPKRDYLKVTKRTSNHQLKL